MLGIAKRPHVYATGVIGLSLESFMIVPASSTLDSIYFFLDLGGTTTLYLMALSDDKARLVMYASVT